MKTTQKWNKVLLSGMAAMVLAFGLVMTGCGPDDPNEWSPEYAIGDTGPGGGKVFSVSRYGFGPDRAWHYTEAAPADITGQRKWDSRATNDSYNHNLTGTTEASGGINTAVILASDTGATAATSAAKACDEYTNGGKDDWYLPSYAELEEMYINKTAIGGFSSDVYWSSSQDSGVDRGSGMVYQAKNLRFSDGLRYGGNGKSNKHVESKVRAVRAF